MATPEYAQDVHKFIRGLIRLRNQAVADSLVILYGGSVNQHNAGDLFIKGDIDGALIGGASLNASQFASICAIQSRQVLQLATLLSR